MEAIRDAIQNMSLYEVKAAVRKAQNVVMNYTEMEAKVREATNNEPWGASSTLLSEIASGTYNYQLLNEIMPMIYRRFNEKTAEEWRQIYKALQLLEYLIKNGSEQVIDDARSHLSTIKMLRQFYYIDSNGKDQGINVRNRAKELAELLSDVDKVRSERKKARQYKTKFGGVEGNSYSGGGFGRSSSSMGGSGRRYGGFGNDSSDYGGYPGSSTGVYGDGGGFGGNSGFHDDGYTKSDFRSNQKFEEYNEFEDSNVVRSTTSSRRVESTASSKGSKPPPKRAEAEIDLLGVDSDPIPPPQPSKTSGRGPSDDDEFDDFQSPPSSSAMPSVQSVQTPPPLTSSASNLSLVQPKPVSTNQQSSMSSLVGLMSHTVSAASSNRASPAATPAVSSGIGGMLPPMKQTTITGYQPSQPNYFTSVLVTSNPVDAFSGAPSSSQLSQAKKASGSDAFGSIWNQASLGIKKTTNSTTKTPSLQTMAKEKATAGIWGAGPATNSKPVGKTGGDLDDLLS